MTFPSWLRGGALLIVTFAAGAMAGVGYERHLATQRRAAPANAPALMAHFSQELQLDSSQQTAIGAILARHQGAVDSAWRALQPHVGATLDSVHSEIMAVLTPAQQTRFVSLMQVMHGH